MAGLYHFISPSLGQESSSCSDSLSTYTWWYLIIDLTCLPLITNDADHLLKSLSETYMPSLLVTNSNLLSSFNWNESIIYSEYKSIVRYMTCKYFPQSGLLFHFLNSTLRKQNFNLMKSINVSFIINAFCVVFKNSLKNSRSLRLSPVSF